MSEAPIQGKRRCACVGNEEVLLFACLLFRWVVGRKKRLERELWKMPFMCSQLPP